MLKELCSAISLTMVFIVLLSSNCLAFTSYGSPPSYSYRIYRIYLLLLPVVSVIWGVPYLLSKQRTTKPFIIAVGILTILGAMSTMWEVYAWGEAFGFVVGFLWFIFIVIVNYCLIRSSDNPDRDRRLFTIFLLPAVVLAPFLAASDWVTFCYMPPVQTIAFSLLLSLPLSILFMGKKRSARRKVAEVTSLVVVGCFPTIVGGSTPPLFLGFEYFLLACLDIARHLGYGG